jgi:hypothetical protein
MSVLFLVIHKINYSAETESLNKPEKMQEQNLIYFITSCGCVCLFRYIIYSPLVNRSVNETRGPDSDRVIYRWTAVLERDQFYSMDLTFDAV